MQKYQRRLRCFVAVILMVVATLVVARPAQASFAVWQRQLDPVTSPTILTHPDGSVSVGRIAGSNPYAIQTVNSANTTLHRVPVGTSLEVSPNAYQWEVAVDGTIYVPESELVGQGSRAYLSAYKDGNLVWRVLPPDSCPGYWSSIHALRVGSNGHVYVVHGRQMGCGGSENFFTGFDSQTGAVLFSLSLGGNFWVSPTGMFPYSAGIALLGGSPLRLRYYSYQGALISETAIPVSNDEWQSWPVATHDGRVYITIGSYRSLTEDCPWPWTSVIKRIVALDSDGFVLDANSDPLQYDVQPCAHVYPVTLPSGGLALTVRAYDLDDRLLVLDANLNEVWDAAFDTGMIGEREFPNWLGHEIWADNNGNIVTLTPYWRNSQRYRGVQIAVIDSANGTRKSVFHTDQLDAELSFATYGGKIGLANGMFYLAAHVCGSYDCNSGHPFMLYAVPVAGLAMDYPRARIVGQSPVAQNALKYVALGDSFSSGEGVEPFSPPSNANGCHRSERAYPRLLDVSPWLNIELRGFKACSGATTTDVISGRNGEPSQLDALDEDVDLVTITIGGNDIEFEAFASACVDPVSSCETSSPRYAQSMYKIQSVLPAALDALFAEIRDRVGTHTRILVVGYPYLVLPGSSALGYCAYLSAEEKVAIHAITTALNDKLRASTVRSGSQVEFVDAAETFNGLPISPFAGHELCHEDSYFNGAMLPEVYSFHPNWKGQAAYEELVRRYLMRP